MKTIKQFFSPLFLFAMLLVAFVCAPYASAQSVSNLYAAGVSYNSAGQPTVAGTALYAHQASADSAPGVYAFSVLDVLPQGSALNVTTNVGVGVAEKVSTIHGVDVFVPTSAGISFDGSNTGWAYSGGVMAAYKPRADKNFYILPSVRFLKSSVGGGGYQLIPGVLFGFGK